MKSILFKSLILLFTAACTYAQDSPSKKEKPLYTLIDQYAQAREVKDTILLNKILTEDIDQLVSTGEWRRGYKTAKEGMLRSSATNPGDRVLTVEHTRFLNDKTAIIDARYEIRNSDGSIRKMWSTFIAIKEQKTWKISAIRNMLPRGQN
ncbi:DUF4440 domain-containing protein [Pseudozobellia sp. WGM2]|uniref:DUF4440 domain-containing protein n=1 Tax=Pseudozobellia sp. WGM2 TaxID=2787625 RepID=UPI001AE07BEF|nr:DUF4440 domain-containing protein [Pseudozobellia sp. WGM2]